MNQSSAYILGINCAYHESSAALIADGHIVCAVEEERFNGFKHGKPLHVDNADDLPWNAINACLDEAGIGWSDLDAVGYSLDPHLRRQHACLGTEGDPNQFGHPVGEARFQRSIRRVRQRLPLSSHTSFHYVPHHEAHAWYALGTSEFDDAAVLIIDGIGEGATVSLGCGTRSQLTLEKQTFFPSSLGLSWEKVACFLGLGEYDASKVMALAGLSSEVSHTPFEEALRVHEGSLVVDPEKLDLEHPDDHTDLHKLFGTPKSLEERCRVAAGLQATTEKRIIELARFLRDAYRTSRLAYGGGVALNCKANARLAESGLFQHIHAGPASHDGGTSLGAAWWIHTQILGRAIPLQEKHLTLFSGPRASMTQHGRDYQLNTALIQAATRLLKTGTPVAWAMGPCEFGPRALGARSLLAPAWDKGIVSKINQIKGRYTFEPLALSVATERAEEVFDIPSPARSLALSMLTTVRPTPAWAERLQHLTHADGTVRVQVVEERLHPEFHALLAELDRQMGWPLLVNTSLNPRGRPMAEGLDESTRLAASMGVDNILSNLVDSGMTSLHDRPLGKTLPRRIASHNG